MASSDNENHASKFVNDPEIIIQEKEEAPLAAAGGGGEEEEATAEEAKGGSQKKSTYTQVLMASSDNEIHASNFVNGMEIIEEKEEDEVAAAATAAKEEEEEAVAEEEEEGKTREAEASYQRPGRSNDNAMRPGKTREAKSSYYQRRGRSNDNAMRPGNAYCYLSKTKEVQSRESTRGLRRRSSNNGTRPGQTGPNRSKLGVSAWRTGSGLIRTGNRPVRLRNLISAINRLVSVLSKRNSGMNRPPPPPPPPPPLSASSATSPRRVWEEQSLKYLPLFKALLRGDWEKAERIIKDDEDAVTAKITQNNETALHVAVRTGKSIDFVKYLVDLMPVEALALTDVHGYTALNSAARFGNTKAVEIIAQQHPDSLYIRNNENWLPVHRAAQSTHKDTFSHLWKVTEKDHTTEKATKEGNVVDQPKPYEGQSGVELLLLLIGSGFYDEALNLVRRHPDVAKSPLAGHADPPEDDSKGDPSASRPSCAVFKWDRLSECALGQLTKKPSSFSSGSRLTSCQRLLYNYVPLKLESDNENQNGGDIENPTNNSQVIAHKDNWIQFLRENFSISAKKKLKDMLWKVLVLVPCIKHIREQKLMHDQALQLVKCLCQEIRSLKDLTTGDYKLLVEGPLLAAARLGICEIVEEIMDSFPMAINAVDSERHNIFHLAVIKRQENVFNLLYQMSEYKQYITRFEDNYRNIILHLVGRLAPKDKLNLVPGAALQMQRELQWFKEVEKFVNPSYIEKKNNIGDTPSKVFTRGHEDLVVEGEKWMKDRSSSCTIVAALIASVVFTAAITVPGGNNGASGLPIFSKEKAFIVFIVSDAIALFTSTTSLLMFLSILTSRYAESDFLYVLPKRLIIGLVTLFLSITSMILAFSSTLYLVIGLNTAWTLIPVVALASLPIFSFVSVQFPLLVDLISSTYCHGIFGKKSNRPFY